VVGAAQLGALPVKHARPLDGQPHLCARERGWVGGTQARAAAARVGGPPACTHETAVHRAAATNTPPPSPPAHTDTQTHTETQTDTHTHTQTRPAHTWLRRPGMASIFTPREGTAQLWITSALVTSRRTRLLVGSTRRSSTSSSRSCPGSTSACCVVCEGHVWDVCVCVGGGGVTRGERRRRAHSSEPTRHHGVQGHEPPAPTPPSPHPPPSTRARAPVSMYESKLYSAFLGPSSRLLAMSASVTRLRSSLRNEGSSFSLALSASRADCAQAVCGCRARVCVCGGGGAGGQMGRCRVRGVCCGVQHGSPVCRQQRCARGSARGRQPCTACGVRCLAGGRVLHSCLVARAHAAAPPRNARDCGRAAAAAVTSRARAAAVVGACGATLPPSPPPAAPGHSLPAHAPPPAWQALPRAARTPIAPRPPLWLRQPAPAGRGRCRALHATGGCATSN
jgi:hypothetical protein